MKATKLLDNEEINTRTRDIIYICQKYFHTVKQCNSISAILEGLKIDGRITLNQLYSKLNSSARPTLEKSLEMLEDFCNQNLFTYIIKDNRSIIIMKGDRYRV